MFSQTCRIKLKYIPFFLTIILTLKKLKRNIEKPTNNKLDLIAKITLTDLSKIMCWEFLKYFRFAREVQCKAALFLLKFQREETV